jgi:tetratricopeptide (TPR) repeat protein
VLKFQRVVSLVTVALFTTLTVTTQSTPELLEKAIFLELTKGDVDGAAKIYAKIVEKNKANRKDVAEALYRLGTCQEKLGKEKEAQETFRKVVEKYADRKILVAKARARLSNSEKPAEPVELNKEIELTINDDTVVEDSMLDFETGNLSTPPKKYLRRSAKTKLANWVAEQGGIDVFAEIGTQSVGLHVTPGSHWTAASIDSDDWEKPDLSKIREKIDGQERGSSAKADHEELPAFFAFKTDQGSVGVLQMVRVRIQKRDGFLELKYKLIHRRKSGTTKPYKRDHQCEASTKSPENVSEEDRVAAESLSAEGWQLWGQRKLVEAESKFTKAVKRDPTVSHYWNGLGWSQLNQGKRLAATKSFECCLSLEIKHAAAWNGLGWIAYGQDKKDDAIRHWEKAVDASPNATASLSGLVKVYLERKDYDKAIKWCEFWLQHVPGAEEAEKQLKRVRKIKKEAQED